MVLCGLSLSFSSIGQGEIHAKLNGSTIKSSRIHLGRNYDGGVDVYLDGKLLNSKYYSYSETEQLNIGGPDNGSITRGTTYIEIDLPGSKSYQVKETKETNWRNEKKIIQQFMDWEEKNIDSKYRVWLHGVDINDNICYGTYFNELINKELSLPITDKIRGKGEARDNIVIKNFNTFGKSKKLCLKIKGDRFVICHL